MRLSIDFGGTNLKLGLINETPRFVDFAEISLNEFPEGKAFLEALFDRLDIFLAGRVPEVVGLAAKGGVDLKNAEVLSDIGAGKWLVGKDLRQQFETHFGVPFILDNDARAYGLGEYQFGAGQGASTLVCLTLGTGVGCSVLNAGIPYQSSDPLGGLLGGHISIDRNGLPCSCGNRGCLERYVSATALHDIINKKYESLLVPDQDPVATFFSQGTIEVNTALSRELVRYQDNLTQGIVNIIHAYGPDRIVIGGGVSQSAEYFLPAVKERVYKMSWTTPKGGTEIVAASLGNKAALLGMAFHPTYKNYNS
jgi:glucokinase